MTVWCEVMQISASDLAVVLRQHSQNTLIVDCRGFADYNFCHIKHAINSFFAKIMRKRLLENKVDQRCLLEQLAGPSCRPLDNIMDVILYGEEQEKVSRLCPKRRIGSCNLAESSSKLLHVLRDELVKTGKFQKILILEKGFGNFQKAFPQHCEGSSGGMSRLPASVSQPCLSQVQNEGPTQILPFLFLGSQQDALDEESIRKHKITHVLNLSIACPRAASIILEENFMRIPVNDNYQEKLSPFFDEAYNFLERVRKSKANVLIHCLAGISRSPTVAISYIMKHKRMSSDEAYRFVKERRPTISPNFNFMGQLLEYEQQLVKTKLLPEKQTPNCTREAAKVNITSSCSVKVPKSASSHCVFIQKPCDPSTPSGLLNENGKRNFETLENCPTPDRPRALLLGSFRPRRFGEELSSPSSELSKLRFDCSDAVPTAASEFPTSLTNPCFLSPTSPQPEESKKDKESKSSSKHTCLNLLAPFLMKDSIHRPRLPYSSGILKTSERKASQTNQSAGRLSTTTEESEPDAGFQDGFRPLSPDEQDRLSLSSQSSVEIAVS
ncbi:unnamed protein product [Auanema sp. JU1783]|nr:unnamed protein product [Auanema sp. JU1783]